MVRPGYSDGGTKALLSFAAGDLQYDRRDIQRQKEIVAKRFDGADWVVPEMLDAMWVAPDFSLGRDSLIRLPRWARGRAALVGDSAWASFAGHGTSFAVVGAYLLAGELKAAAGDHETAFARYEKLLRPYVDLGQQGPPGGDSMFLPKTRSAIWLRNQSIRALPHMPWRGLIAKGADKALAIPLPNYAN
jgi:2-polyprenyl-6-methoxyphenol hydroxylase-like FAD-dependent oxidoreductase